MQIAVLKDCNELENCKASFELITFEIAPAIQSVQLLNMFKNGPTRPLFVFKHNFFRKTVDISGIGTRIAGVEGEHADHSIITTAPAIKYVTFSILIAR